MKIAVVRFSDSIAATSMFKAAFRANWVTILGQRLSTR